MDASTFSQIINIVQDLLQKDPKNETNKELLKIIIEKKSEYDLEQLKMQKDLMRYIYNFSMQNKIFKHELESQSIGNKKINIITAETIGFKLVDDNCEEANGT